MLQPSRHITYFQPLSVPQIVAKGSHGQSGDGVGSWLAYTIKLQVTKNSTLIWAQKSTALLCKHLVRAIKGQVAVVIVGGK